MRTFRLLCPLALALVPLFAFGQEAPSIFTFQEFGPGGVPKGWSDNSKGWADVDVTYGADRIGEEEQVARITIGTARKGRAQMIGPALSLEKGRVYTVNFRAKTTPGGTIDLGIREQVAPFHNYAARHLFTGTPDWQTQVVTFTAAESMPADHLVLGFAPQATYWIENIQVSSETAEQAAAQKAAAAPTGDVLPNGDFRVGTYGWSTSAAVDRKTQYPLYTGRNYALDPPDFVVTTAGRAPIGRMTLSQFNSSLCSDMSTMQGGAAFNCIARVRRSEGRGPVTLHVISPLGKSGFSIDGDVGTDWTELHLVGNVPLVSDIQMRCELVAKGPGTLEVSSVRLVQTPGAIPDDRRTAFGAEPDRPMTAYQVGETPVITLRAAGGDPAARAVDWTLSDSLGQQLRTGHASMTSTSTRLPLDGLPVGWYQFRWHAPWAQNRMTDVVNMSVVPPIGRQDGDASPWGIHVEGSSIGVKKMQLLGVHWLRINNPLWTKWTAVEPEKDKWIFPDESVDLFTKAGLGIVGDLDRTPLWASSNPADDRPTSDYMGSKSYLPANWSDWETYVRRMVSRYKGQIKYWEIWNEPDIVFLTPPAGETNEQAYLQLLEHAVPIIKKENPDALVLGSPAYILHKRANPQGYQPDFTDRLIDDGGMKWLDVVGVHTYFARNERLFDDPPRLAKLDTIRAAMKAAGKKPVLWESEWGIVGFTLPCNDVRLPTGNQMTGDEVAREIVAWNVAQLAAGLEKLFPYDAEDNFYLPFQVTKYYFDYRQPRPVFTAYAILTKVLDGLRYDADDSQVQESGRVIAFKGPAGEVRVAYAQLGKSFTLPLPAGTVAVDYMGREVAATGGQLEVKEGPIYFAASDRFAFLHAAAK